MLITGAGFDAKQYIPLTHLIFWMANIDFSAVIGDLESVLSNAPGWRILLFISLLLQNQNEWVAMWDLNLVDVVWHALFCPGTQNEFHYKLTIIFLSHRIMSENALRWCVFDETKWNLTNEFISLLGYPYIPLRCLLIYKLCTSTSSWHKNFSRLPWSRCKNSDLT